MRLDGYESQVSLLVLCIHIHIYVTCGKINHSLRFNNASLQMFKMCKEEFWLCFCCEDSIIDRNYWKCFYSIEDYSYFKEKNNPNHKIYVKTNKTLFEMCFLCKKYCFEKCQLKTINPIKKRLFVLFNMCCK